MKKVTVAMMVILTLTLTACGTVTKTVTAQQKSSNSSGLIASEIEVSPSAPSKNWNKTVNVPVRYGAQTVVKVRNGSFLENEVGKVYSTTDPKTHQTLHMAFLSNSEEVVEPETPGTSGNFGITIYSTQPHAYVSTGYQLNLSYAISVITPALAKEMPEFVYPSRVDVDADHSLRDRVISYLTKSSTPYSAYITAVNTYDSRGQSIFKFSYRETPAQLSTVKTDVHRILQNIIKPGMDVYEKEFAIHNWIATHVKYDNSPSGENDSDFTALISGKTQCAGIAALTYQMLSAAGIDNQMVTGDVHTATYQQYGKTITEVAIGGQHIWNEVMLDGKWYMLDVTADLTSENHGAIGYNFFNLTSSQLGHTHTWDGSGLPNSNTDFVNVLQHSKNPQDQKILHDIES